MTNSAKGGEKRTMRRAKDQRRIPVSMRIAPDMREWLVRRATASGRSITQEAELALEQMRRDEERAALFYVASFSRESQMAGLIELLARVASNASRTTTNSVLTGNFLSDVRAFATVDGAIRQVLDLLNPSDDTKTTDDVATALGRRMADGYLMLLTTRPPPPGHDDEFFRFGASIGSKLGNEAISRAHGRVSATAPVLFPETGAPK